MAAFGDLLFLNIFYKERDLALLASYESPADTNAIGGSKGALGTQTTPFLVQFLSFHVIFSKRFCQLIGFYPILRGWRPSPPFPASGKFWVCHLMQLKTMKQKAFRNFTNFPPICFVLIQSVPSLAR